MIINRYTEVDIARKVVGVGSVGTRCTIALFLGGGEGDDPLFMQIKEAGPSVLEPYVGVSPYPNHGQRVVHGQRLMQAVSDVLLGWSTHDGRDFYVRQLRDMKWSAEVEMMNPSIFTSYVELCAATLARAHAPVTRHKSAATWGTRISSIAPLPRLLSPMPTRPNATMRPSWRPCKKGAYKPKPGCKQSWALPFKREASELR